MDCDGALNGFRVRSTSASFNCSAYVEKQTSSRCKNMWRLVGIQK